MKKILMFEFGDGSKKLFEFRPDDQVFTNEKEYQEVVKLVLATEFEDYDSKEEFIIQTSAFRYWSAIWDTLQFVRNKLKYGDLAEGAVLIEFDHDHDQLIEQKSELRNEREQFIYRTAYSNALEEVRSKLREELEDTTEF